MKEPCMAIAWPFHWTPAPPILAAPDIAGY